MSELDTEDEDMFSFAASHHRLSRPALTAADIEEVAGEEGIIAQLMDIRQKQNISPQSGLFQQSCGAGAEMYWGGAGA